MMDTPHTGSPDEAEPSRYAEHITRLISTSPYASMLADEAGMRARLYRHLADSEDPVTAELGAQLRDGIIDLAAASRVPAYADVFLRGMDTLAETDFRMVAADLDALAEREGWGSEGDEGFNVNR